MTVSTYLVLGFLTMLVKLAVTLVAAHRSAAAKTRSVKEWTAFNFLVGVAFWPIEAIHFVYVILNSILSSLIEAA